MLRCCVALVFLHLATLPLSRSAHVCTQTQGIESVWWLFNINLVHSKPSFMPFMASYCITPWPIVRAGPSNPVVMHQPSCGGHAWCHVHQQSRLPSQCRCECSNTALIGQVAMFCGICRSTRLSCITLHHIPSSSSQPPCLALQTRERYPHPSHHPFGPLHLSLQRHAASSSADELNIH